jgi:SAM-dependent methyltransferase
VSLLDSTIRHFRRSRMRLFFEVLGAGERTRVLDVGGTELNWLVAGRRPLVTLANLPRGIQPAFTGFAAVAATGCRLPFRDRSFDVVFSNSVIEHIADPGERRRFAAEIRRVGRSYWVQTPNRRFPVEPHLWTPFLHYLPRGVQRALVRRFTVWELLERPTPDRREFYLEHYLNDVRLLDAEELRNLFPEARILRERFLGITKSLVAVSRDGA